MNERIKQLIEQAGYIEAHYASDDGPFVPAEFNKEKFAELLVRECVAQCEKNTEHPYLGPGSKLSAFNIKEHFGV